MPANIPVNTIICGAMPEATKVFSDGYFNCCISSPPYWALRDYGVAGQLGLEPTFEEYIDKLCTIYDEVKRVLRPDGTCWVNLGDTYSAKGTGKGQSNQLANKGDKCNGFRSAKYLNQDKIDTTHLAPEKSLCLIPQRFAIEMVNRGWILRNVIIWHKPNPMPSSAKDRFTVDFEYVYFFVKSKKYWFESQYEPIVTEPHSPGKIKIDEGVPRHNPSHPSQDQDRKWGNPLGRNKRTCWEMSREEWLEWCDSMWVQAAENGAMWKIPTQAFPDAHFATYPEKLVEPMIKAGCPEFVCTKCGKAREKLWDIEYTNQSMSATEKYANPVENTAPTFGRGNVKNYFKGYTDCGCNAEWRPGIVLDCFCRVRDDLTSSCAA